MADMTEERVREIVQEEIEEAKDSIEEIANKLVKRIKLALPR